MSVKVATNRLIVSSLQAGFYQQLLSKVSSFQELGNRLVTEAETAQAFRHIERTKELGLALIHFPTKEYRLVGQYFLGWCGLRSGEDTQSIFEHVIEESSTYKVKALTALATIKAKKGDLQLGFKYYAEAMKYSDNPSGFVQAMRSVIAVHGMEGCHNRALKDLLELSSVAKYASPLIKYQYLNSLAVELGEAGRIQEAQGVCNIVLASPYAFAYPEWRETGREIAFRGYKSRSVVSVGQRISRSLLYLPEREASDTPIQSEPAPVLSYLEWKSNMVKQPNGDDIPPNATEKDLYLKLMEMVAQRDLSVSELRQVIAFVEKITSKQD